MIAAGSQVIHHGLRMGHWFADAAGAIVRCPTCPDSSMAILRRDIAPDGAVQIPLQCRYYTADGDCTFRGLVRLEGWGA